MAITVIDKIKQKNQQTFKLLDAIDVHGRVTGWQDPVARIVADVASIPSLTDGETFILVDASGAWPSFTGKDIYERLASAQDNAIYQKQTSTAQGTPAEYYLVTSPGGGMVTLDKNSMKLKVYNGAEWIDLIPVVELDGKILTAEVHLVVDTDGDPGANYNTTTKRLEIGVELQEGDNINIYVNGIKYTYGENFNAIDYLAGETWVAWIPHNVGFDLINGDEVEIEIFR
jgi:hypothetical protein